MIKEGILGREVVTKYGSILKIVGWDGTTIGKVKKHRKYTLECSVCSKDKELWPYGSIKSTLSNLSSGVVPCGCCLNPRWTEDQNIVRVQRECENRGYVLHGWYSEYQYGKTYVDLENPRTSNRWHTTTISDLLSGYGDPVEGRIILSKKVSRPDEELTSEIVSTGAFLDGTKFYRNTERKGTDGWQAYWDYTCPKCSHDEYVQAGVCNGVFTSALVSLKAGYRSCRCSEGYRWTKDQRRYQINKRLKQINGTFIQWIGEYKNSASRFEYICAKGVKHNIDVNGFINGESLCRCFAGYSKALSGKLYITLWYSEEDNIALVKFGITNRSIKERNHEQRKRNKPLKSKLLFSYEHEDGGLIEDIECETKQKWKQYLTVPKDLLPDGYTEAFFYNEEVLSEIKSHVESRII